MITLLNLKVYIYARNIQAEHIEIVIELLDEPVNAAYADAKLVWNAETKELSYEIPGYEDDAIAKVKIDFTQAIGE